MRFRPTLVSGLFGLCLALTGALSACSGSSAVDGSSPPAGGAAQGGGGAQAGSSSSGAPANVAGSSAAGSFSAGAASGGAAGGAPAAAGSGGAGVAGASGGNAASGTAGAAGVSSSGNDVPLDPALLGKCTGSNPIQCTFDAPNGNYDVTAEVGDALVAATSQLSAETRHYQGPAVATAAGAFTKLTFTVNVRAEKHDGGQSAPGNVLDVTLSGPNQASAPKLHGIGFRAAKTAVTLFFAGDSTACDWVDSNTSNLGPGETGSAQALSRYLKPGVAVANYADSGETAGGFYGKFFDPYATSVIKEGDFVFVQFGTNDSKDAATTANNGKVYKDNLLKYVTAARAKKATPVILTPVSRKGGTATAPGFEGLDQAARDFAAAQNVALIDMTALSRDYYATVADKNALFVDSGTHFSELGAIGVAGVETQALKGSTLSLKDFVK